MKATLSENDLFSSMQLLGVCIFQFLSYKMLSAQVVCNLKEMQMIPLKI